MKHTIILLVALLFIGCEFLDKEPDDMKTDTMVWSNRNEVLKYLTNCYAALPMDRLHQDDPWLGCSDECDITWSAYPTYGINQGNWNPSTNFYNKWATYYKAIRATFVFENNVDKCSELAPDLRNRYLGEALFLRGYYYFLLLRQYGPVVLLKQEMSNSTDFGNMPRTPFEECVSYVCELMDRAETLLPMGYASGADELGRATIPACRAVKSSMLLLAASPQWNGNQEYADIARKTFDIILSKVDNPKGKWNKLHPGTRNLKNFALPMILCNLALEIEHLLDESYLKETMETCIHEVMEVFYRPELGGIIVENVDIDGSLVDCFEGRQVTPGHAIEAMWFIMDLGKRLNRPELIEKAKETTLTMLNYGWDKEYGGIYYFMDRNGCPPQQLEWDQKLWWVHIETLISLLKGYQLTGDQKCLEWFEKVHDYTWGHFKDKEYPEWYGYLNRRGEVLLPLKGGKWKGCFHVPRGLYQCWKTLEEITNIVS